jgi:hypothetical protein
MYFKIEVVMTENYAGYNLNFYSDNEDGYAILKDGPYYFPDKQDAIHFAEVCMEDFHYAD